jgi:predicted nucleic acid-binding protein
VALLDTANLIVPTLCLYEVGKRMLISQGEAAALEVLEMMKKSRVVEFAPDDHFAAPKTPVTHRLAMADALSRQTAQSFGAALHTMDSGL